MEVYNGYSSFSQPEKVGYLHTLARSSFLGKEKWKRKYYIVVGSNLLQFKSLDEAVSERNAEKVISLDRYDVCQRDEKDVYSRNFVFILDGTVGDSLQPKYVFAASSLNEMKDWIGKIRIILSRIQQNKKFVRTAIPSAAKKEEIRSDSESSSSDEMMNETLRIGDIVNNRGENQIYGKNKAASNGITGDAPSTYRGSEDSLNVWDNDGHPVSLSKKMTGAKPKYDVESNKQVVVDMDVDTSGNKPKIELEVNVPPGATQPAADITDFNAKIRSIFKNNDRKAFINLKKIIDCPDDYTMVETVAARTMIAFIILFIFVLIAGFFYFRFLLNGIPKGAL